MEKPSYFQTALSNFVTDAACGGAVRHLTDIGYTLDQIVERLDYPAPRSKVQQIMMEYLYESKVLLKDEPSIETLAPKTQYIQEQDAFGRRTMRKVENDYNGQYKMTNTPVSTTMSQVWKISKNQEIIWRESVYDSSRNGKLTELLYEKCNKNGETCSYISCAFDFLNIDQNGYLARKESGGAVGESIGCLNNRQREYLFGIRWEKPVMYHRLNQRMLEIVGKLYEAGIYSGTCFFINSQEKIRIPKR